jgi:hypothetical protein
MKAAARRLKVIDYFRSHPQARVKDVADRFKVSVPTAYSIRKVAQQFPMVKAAQQPEVLDQAQANEVYQQSLVSKNPDDEQIGGDHYRSLGVQPWHAMEAWMTPEAFAGFLRGNAIKYLARSDRKGGVDDIRKARHYINKLIEVSERTA